jgi:hypothetical protein
MNASPDGKGIKSQLRGVRKRESGEAIDSGSIGPLEEGTAEAHTLFFEPVKKPAGPNKFGGEDTQGEKDCKRPWTGHDDHHDAENKKAEAGEDFEEPLCLLHGLNDHFISTCR